MSLSRSWRLPHLAAPRPVPPRCQGARRACPDNRRASRHFFLSLRGLTSVRLNRAVLQVLQVPVLTPLLRLIVRREPALTRRMPSRLSSTDQVPSLLRWIAKNGMGLSVMSSTHSHSYLSFVGITGCSCQFGRTSMRLLPHLLHSLAGGRTRPRCRRNLGHTQRSKVLPRQRSRPRSDLLKRQALLRVAKWSGPVFSSTPVRRSFYPRRPSHRASLRESNPA